MSNEELSRLARIERLLEEQQEKTERLLMLLAAGQGKRIEQLEKKLLASLV